MHKKKGSMPGMKCTTTILELYSNYFTISAKLFSGREVLT
jgi:hypothetical protein